MIHINDLHIGAIRSGGTTRKASRQAAGFVPFPAKPGVVATNEQVNALRDAEGV